MQKVSLHKVAKALPHWPFYVKHCPLLAGGTSQELFRVMRWAFRLKLTEIRCFLLTCLALDSLLARLPTVYLLHYAVKERKGSY